MIYEDDEVKLHRIPFRVMVCPAKPLKMQQHVPPQPETAKERQMEATLLVFPQPFSVGDALLCQELRKVVFEGDDFAEGFRLS